MAVWEVINVTNWLEYIQHLQTSKMFDNNWIFRGQAKFSWEINNSFTRFFNKIVRTRIHSKKRTLTGIYHLDREQSLIAMFKSKSHLYSSLNPEQLIKLRDIQQTDSDLLSVYSSSSHLYDVFIQLEWLAIMQHYSAPTRLIDWTKSAYIATYFALEDFSSDACVYAFDTNLLDKFNKELTRKTSFKVDLFDKIEPTDFGTFITYSPLIKNQRISQQQGLFLLPTNIIQSPNNVLQHINNELCKPLGKVYKFDKKMISDSIKELQNMGITAETMYPGIEGLAKSLKFEMLSNA